MEQRVSVITLGVDDLDRSRRFYSEGLGWDPAMAAEEVVFYQLNGMVLGLFPKEELREDARLDTVPAEEGAVALAYNTRRREDVDDVLDEAVEAGADLLKPGEEAFWGGYSGYFRDPDGHLWEVAWNPEWPIDEQGNVWFS